MTIFQSSIYGVIQGIAEFLPISSSAHLVIVPFLLGWQYQGLVFDVALHFGTVIAILAFFAKDWIEIIKLGFGGILPGKKTSQSSTTASYPNNLLWQIIIASIPAAVAGFLIADYVERYLHSPLLLALNLIIFGGILYLVDKKASSKSSFMKIGYGQSFLVGISQCLALIPGVSRSGITMIASRGLGLEREKAARFAFLLGTPAMVGAFLFEAKNITASQLTAPFIIAVAVSAIVGFISIKFLLDYLKKGSFLVFFIYRLILAAIVILALVF